MDLLLIADDNADVLVLLVMLFQRAGFIVLTAADGAAALQRVRAERPDVVLTDLDMPGMDGLELCRAIRADDDLRDTPVAILSGGLKPGDPRVRDAGLCGVLLKPFSNQELVAAVRHLAAAGRHDHAATPSSCPLEA